VAVRGGKGNEDERQRHGKSYDYSIHCAITQTRYQWHHVAFSTLLQDNIVSSYITSINKLMSAYAMNNQVSIRIKNVGVLPSPNKC
jgi:hypothetical protein